MRKFTIYLGLGLLGLALGNTNTQAAPTLTLKEAEQTALEHHPEIFAAEYNARAAEQTVRAVRSDYFPTAIANITGVTADRGTRIGAGTLQASQLFSREAQGVTIDQLITDSGRTSNLASSSRFQARAASEDTQVTREDVLLAVNRAYFEVLRAEALLRVARQTVAERQVVQKQVSAMVQNKLKSTLDLSFANVNLAQARLLQIQTQNNLRAAEAQLTRAMGLQSRPRSILRETPLPPAPPPSSATLVTEAMSDRPELISLQFQQQSAYKFQRAERDLSYPTVIAEGDAGYIPKIAQLTLPREIPNHYEAAAINVEVPIFNGHLFAARREAALMKAHEADEDLRDMRERIARDVRVAWASAATGYQQISVANQILKQSKLALNLAQGRYKLGLSSIVALNQAQLSETQAAVQRVNAKYNFESDNAELQYQVGTLH